ncbi:STAS domain-containing protein [Nocardia donostiensis]|uniref:STAS domain-containing protein n=1 Tax=Nocardia donostiensis TaxID=1538463 RepID=A0A1V2TH03_9NOCA|nr:STAS domain-containing protein [Nocardia donostiensis]ONM48790.1 hypothetical protein B0T46_09835 [Nocardia donostiensis]OQS13010.1 hypothetical protein B0T36_22120 [Nocardia donostiensis]OQS18208.1 hypothetical protein B0T44_20925 [Nocardia donostiensis]
MSATAALHHADELRRHEERTSHSSRMWSAYSNERANYVIARVEGELDAALDGDFKTLLARCRSGGCPVVILDLRATTFMGIRAAAALAAAKTRAWHEGTELRVVSGRKEVERVLEVAGVRPLFRYYPTMRAALQD